MPTLCNRLVIFYVLQGYLSELLDIHIPNINISGPYVQHFAESQGYLSELPHIHVHIGPYEPIFYKLKGEIFKLPDTHIVDIENSDQYVKICSCLMITFWAMKFLAFVNRCIMTYKVQGYFL